jgi:hypothetical protein
VRTGIGVALGAPAGIRVALGAPAGIRVALGAPAGIRVALGAPAGMVRARMHAGVRSVSGVAARPPTPLTRPPSVSA